MKSSVSLSQCIGASVMRYRLTRARIAVSGSRASSTAPYRRRIQNERHKIERKNRHEHNREIEKAKWNREGDMIKLAKAKVQKRLPLSAVSCDDASPLDCQFMPDNKIELRVCEKLAVVVGHGNSLRGTIGIG